MEFKRLLEFCNSLPSVSYEDIQNRLPEALKQHPQAFEPYEKALQRLDNTNWEAIKQKLQNRTQKHELRGWAQFFDILSEVMGFSYLLDEGYQNVNFIPETTTRTPDIEGSRSNALVVLLESKTISFSDEERNYILENSERLSTGQDLVLKQVISGVPDGLKNKIITTIESAKNQLLGYLPTDQLRRIVFLTIHLDTEFFLDPSKYAEFKNFLNGIIRDENEVEIVINKEVSTV